MVKMTRISWTTLVRVALACAVVVAVPQHVVRASDTQECLQECFAQYQEDVQECRDHLDARLAEINREAEECKAEAGGDTAKLLRCLRRQNQDTAKAQRDYRRCILLANTRGATCARRCQGTHSHP